MRVPWLQHGGLLVATRGGTTDQAGRLPKTRVVFQGQRAFRTVDAQASRLRGPAPDADLGAAALRTTNLDHQLNVGVLSGRIAAGSQGLDLPDQGTNDVDHAGEGRTDQVALHRVIGTLVADDAQGTQLSRRDRLVQPRDSGMKPQRQVGNDDRASLRTAQRHLVIGLGIGSRRMDAEDRQAFRRGPAQGLAAEFQRTAHNDQLKSRRRQSLIEIAGNMGLGELVSSEPASGKPRIEGHQMMLGMSRKPTCPGLFLKTFTHDQDVHRSVLAPL